MLKNQSQVHTRILADHRTKAAGYRVSSGSDQTLDVLLGVVATASAEDRWMVDKRSVGDDGGGVRTLALVRAAAPIVGLVALAIVLLSGSTDLTKLAVTFVSCVAVAAGLIWVRQLVGRRTGRPVPMKPLQPVNSSHSSG